MSSWSSKDWMVVGGGVVALIASFLDFAGISAPTVFGQVSVSIDAWHSFSILGLLLVLAASTLWALRLFEAVKLPPLAFGWGSATVGAAGLGTLLIIVRAFSYTGLSVEFGGWLLMAAGVVVTVGSALAFNADASAGRSGAGAAGRVPGGSPFGPPPPGAPDWLAGRRSAAPGAPGAPTPPPFGGPPPYSGPPPFTSPPPPAGPQPAGPQPAGPQPAGPPPWNAPAADPQAPPAFSSAPPFPSAPPPPATQPAQRSAPGAEPTGQPPAPAGLSLGERLAEADRLRVEGSISEEEYQALRARIIAGL